MHVYIHTHKNLHSRHRRKWGFSACWEKSQTLMDHKSFVSCAPSGAKKICVFASSEISMLC